MKFSVFSHKVLTVTSMGALLLAVGCSAASKKAATGTAKVTTKQPTRAPKPTTKTGSNVSGNQSSAVSVSGDPTCDAAEEGLAICVDTFALFCAGGKVYGLDCAEGFGGTCGELDGAVDCVVE